MKFVFLRSYMECGGGILSSFFNTRRRREEAERYESFLENGSKVLEEFITKWNGQCSIPIRNFSAGELIRSTNNFDCQHLIDQDVSTNCTEALSENAQHWLSSIITILLTLEPQPLLSVT
ncbi:unnamed protein product [Camellia sinensis]